MPLRLESWSVPFGLLPVFEMNLPEGVLRERLRLALRGCKILHLDIGYCTWDIRAALTSAYGKSE